MENKKFKKWERVLIYLAEKSVGKSVPAWVHEVEKPENLKKLLEEIKIVE